jgi:hypothetical protein
MLFVLALLAGQAASPEEPAATHDPELAELPRKAGEYVTNYARTFRDIVAEETYEQRVAPCALVDDNSRSAIVRGDTRATRSDVAFVALGGAFPWGTFRDVFEVDGRPVRDREARLERLLREDQTSARSRVWVIRQESARYNIGVARTVNEPTLPLAFLLPPNQRRFDFKLEGRQGLVGHAAAVLSFRERQRPTLVSTRDGHDLPARGRFWLDPATGVVLGCEALFRWGTGETARIEIDYQPEAGLDIWVPTEMREVYGSFAGDVACPNALKATARYTSYHRFSVETQETIHYRDLK